MARNHILTLIINVRNKAKDVLKNFEKDLDNVNKTGDNTFNNLNKGSNQAEKQLSRFQNTLHNLSNTFNIVNNIAHRAFGNIADVISRIPARIEQVRETLSKLNPAFQNIAETMRNRIVTAMETIKSNASSVVNSIIGNMGNTVSRITSNFSRITRVTQEIGSQIRTNLGNSWNSIQQNCSNAINVISQHINNITQTAENTGKLLRENLGNSWNSIQQNCSNAITIIQSHFTGLRDSASQVGTEIRTSLGEGWDTVKTKATSTLNSIISKFDEINNKIRHTHDNTNNLNNDINNINNNVNNTGNNISNTFARTGHEGETFRGHLAQIGNSFNNVGGIMAQALGVVGVNSFKQITLQSSITRESLKTLMRATMKNGDEFEKLFNNMDKFTNTSYTSLDMLITAMNTASLQLQLTDTEMNQVYQTMGNLGQLALLMGKDTTTATYLMSESFQGLNGDFQALQDNFSITKDMLLDAGWDGTREDVEGYANAIQKVIDEHYDLNSVMNTTQGRLTKIEKDFKVAGRSIGDKMKPAFDQVLGWLANLKEQCPSAYQAILSVYGGFSILLTVVPQIQTVTSTLSSLWGMIKFVTSGQWALNLAEEANIPVTGANTASNLANAGSMSTQMMARQSASTAILLSTLMQGENTTATGANSLALLANSGAVNENAVVKDALKVSTAILTGEEVVNTEEKNINTGATELNSKAHLGLGNAIKLATRSIWKMTIALLANPWTWVVIAIVAVIAVMVHLYHTNEQFRNSVNALGGALMNILVRAFQSLQKALEPLWKAFQGLYIALIKLWNALTGASESANSSVSAWDVLEKVMEGLVFVVGSLIIGFVTIAEVILGTLIPAVTLCVNIISDDIELIVSTCRNLYALLTGQISLQTFLQRQSEIFDNWSNNITGHFKQFLGDIWTNLVNAGRDYLTSIGSLLGLSADQVAQACDNISNIIANGLNSFIEGVSQIPGALYGILMQIIEIDREWAMNFINSTVGVGIQFAQNILNELFSLPMAVYNILISTLNTVVTWSVNFVMTGVNAGIQFVTGFIMQIIQLPILIGQILYSVLMNIISWGNNVVQQMISLGNRIVTGFITQFKNIVTRTVQVLQDILHRIVTWGVQVVNKMRTIAINMVKEFATQVRRLPGIMWQELMNIGHQIDNATGNLGSRIANLGRRLLSSFLGALGIHSPGYMYWAVTDEMKRLDTRLNQSNDTLSQSAENVGNSMMYGFNKSGITNLSESVNVGDLNLSGIGVSGTIDTSNVMSNTNPITIPTGQVVEDNDEITTSVTAMTDAINPLITQLDTNITTLNNTSMLNTTSMMNYNTLLTASYQNMAFNIATSMNNLQLQDTNSWNNIRTTTQTNLQSILQSTKTVTTQMLDAWKKMKDGIVQSAEQIKNQSTTRFDRLSGTIGTFYRKLRSGGWGTPVKTTPHSGGSRTIKFQNIGTALQYGASKVGATTTSSFPRQQINRSDAISYNLVPQSNMDYVLPNSRSTANVEDLYKMNDKKLQEKIGAGWLDTISPNVQRIKNISNNYSMVGPRVWGKYKTGDNMFKVKEFEHGTPTISFATFKKMAEAVFSQCHYEFYWDSAKYGNWQSAFSSGGMNCSDSSDALVWLARACGLPASKTHGFWNNLGHFWATIQGHKMDTTGWMLHRTWTPSQSHSGPAPVHITENKTKSNSNVEHSGSLDLNINVHVSSDKGIDDNTIAEAVKQALKDNDTLKNIATNTVFQEYDNKVKTRLNRQILRNG